LLNFHVTVIIINRVRKEENFDLTSLELIYGSTALVDLGRFVSFLIHTQSVGLLGWGISPSQGRYLHTGRHKHRINAHRLHASSGIRTNDPSVRAGEDGSCLRPRGHCDWLGLELRTVKTAFSVEQRILLWQDMVLLVNFTTLSVSHGRNVLFPSSG
jgi:hypothetical protein